MATLALDLLLQEADIQPRAQLNLFTVDEYAQAMQDGARFPPIIVFHDGAVYWLADGFHRANAARQIGLAEIEADVRDGTRRDAILFSVGANATHGARRTNEDKRRSVLTLLQDDEWVQWSDREIARRCAVDNSFVSRLRPSVDKQQIGRTVERGGKVYTMQTNNIGAALPPAERTWAQEHLSEATAAGLSRPTLAKAKAVVEAAEREPEKFSDLAQQMDESGKVDGAYKEMTKRQRAAESAQVAQAQDGAPTHMQETIVVQTGEVWQLGRHILYCGDTSKEAFRALLPHAALAFADPPYGAGVKGFDDSVFYWEHDYLLQYADVVAVTPGIVSIFEFARKTTMPYKWSLATWITNGMTRGAVGFGNWIYTALFSAGTVYRQAQDFGKATIDPTKTEDSTHKGRKPSDYMVWLVGLFTQAGDVVLDPFLGSGTTLYTCETMNRRCIGGELDPHFCADIIRRWQDMTGKTAEKSTHAHAL